MNIKKYVALIILCAGLSHSGSAVVLLFEFDARVQAVNSSFPIVEIDDLIAGEIRVDLDTLPTDSFGSSSVAAYLYGGLGIPGYMIQFDTGDELVSFDSLDSTGGDGLTPGIFMYDIVSDEQQLSFVLREEGDIDKGVSIDLFDLTDPNELFGSDDFSADNLDLENLDDSRFVYLNGNSSVFVATIENIQLNVIPEPSTYALLFMGLAALAFRAFKKR
ncbi:MAG: PEP-CTERM sorting domain-containing protein [Verrucomicrobiota bacterium]